MFDALPEPIDLRRTIVLLDTQFLLDELELLA